MRWKSKLTGLLVFAIVVALLPFGPAYAAGDPGGSSGDTVTNLVYNKQPVLSVESGDAAVRTSEQAKVKFLTDSLLGTGDWGKEGSTRYVSFFRNIGRSLVIDLGQPSTLREVNVRALDDPSAGIYKPDYLAVSVSNDDGQSWHFLGKIPNSAAVKLDAKQYVYTLGGLNVKASKIKISFEVDVFIFLDEIEALGLTQVAADAVVPAGADFSPYLPNEEHKFPAPGSAQVGGLKHEYLLYGGWHTNGTVYLPRTYQDMLPVVAYIDGDGVIQDWFYDTILFMNYATSSKNRSYISASTVTSAAYASNKEDWQEYADLLFKPDVQLAALEQAVADVKTKLNQPDYKYKVYISIPKALPIQTNFGVVNGKTLNFDHNAVGDDQALDNRMTAVKWYVDLLMQKWEAAGFKHLSLEGFYWYDEAVHNYASNREEELVKQSTAYMHAKGKKIHWIPFYQAAGAFRWKELGFDFAFIQPNYAFYTSPKTRPTDTADLAKRFGLGVEMEVHHNIFRDEALRTKFYDYLDQGVTAKYMKESALAWYWATDTFQLAYKSTVARDRKIYEDTYNFVKGTYPDKYVPPVIENPGNNPDDGTDDTPGSGPVSGGPGAGYGPGPVTVRPSTPDAERQTIGREQLGGSRDGQVTVQLPAGVREAVLPADGLAKLGDDQLVLHFGAASVQVPAAVLKQITELAADGNGAGAEVIVTVRPVAADQAGDKKPAGGSEGLAVTAAGDLHEFAITIVPAGGKTSVKLDRFSEPVNVEVPYRKGSVNENLIGLYVYNESTKEWDYVGGKADASKGVMTAALNHFSTYAVLEYDKTFDDVGKADWAYEAIRSLSAKHLVEGVSAHAFEPSRSVTRAEFATLLVRMLGLTKDASGAAPAFAFADVTRSDWHYDAIAAASDAGLIQGRSADAFKPQATISREEMAALMVRAYAYASGTRPAGTAAERYSDESDISEWARADVYAASAAGLMQGTGDERFAAKSAVTRAEAAQAIYNLVKQR
ncbi:DUF4855 domain-containing protein [Paenibacillus sp. GYB004]|uniref:DUF4855 domain-containing protein n=1 Tax=Paenibacillus sp. GYB004 TaxID=2994393 RepID=UPI002F968841